jgi:hypothetical protein
MAGLDPAIHVFLAVALLKREPPDGQKTHLLGLGALQPTWMPGTRA